MKHRVVTLVAFASMTAFSTATQAAILFTGNFSQNFNTLQNTPNVDANAATAPTWTNNSTLAGWYGGGTATLAAGYGVGNGSDNTMLANNTTAVASFGTTADSDRAFAPLKRNNSAFIAVALTNSTANAMNSFAVTYTGEQWRDNANATSELLFTYQVNPTDITSGTWTSIAALNFTGPKNTNTGILDGNAAANRTAGINSGLTGLTLNPGQTVWLRWQFSGNNGSYVAVDDLTVTANVIPEPASLVLASLGGLLMLPRRRRA